MRTTRLAMAATAAALVGLPLAAGSAVADDHGSHELTAELTQLNDSGASGTAWALVEGTQVQVKVETQGLLDGAPHAQHIHIGGQNVCPDNGQEGSGFQGALQVSDAADQYGGVAVSLTTDPG
ncbi:CHRD domain-containing protein, partial [Myceligenerans cantabricum]